MIFYFTATGNGKYVAEKIAMKIGDKIIDIADCMKTNSYTYELSEGEAIGIVTPVYFFGVPMIVMEFLQKLKVSGEENFYSYVVLNCGGSTGRAEKFVKQVFSTKAIFGIMTVDNYVPMYKVESKEKIKKQLDIAEEITGKIVEHINRREVGTFNPYEGRFSNIISSLLYPIYKKGRKTHKFTANENCTGCGLCEKVCPRKAIQLEDGKPVWQIPECELCFDCLHRCPTSAINYGKKSEKNGRYINPRTNF